MDDYEVKENYLNKKNKLERKNQFQDIFSCTQIYSIWRVNFKYIRLNE